MDDDTFPIKLHSVDTLAGSFRDYAGLQDYCNAQYTLIQKYETEHARLLAEVEHLKALLSSSTDIIVVTHEQLICEKEIAKLDILSNERALTLEETKRLDLLVKNKYLAQEKSDTINTKSKRVDDISDADLVKMLSTPDV